MAAGAALITLEPSPVNEAMLMAVVAWAAESIRAASLLQSRFTLLLSAVAPQELTQGKTFLELDRVAGYFLTGICVPVYAPVGRARSELGNQGIGCFPIQ
jgi:hypothetical protein